VGSEGTKDLALEMFATDDVATLRRGQLADLASDVVGRVGEETIFGSFPYLE
jgi:hypothetical protein